MEKSLHMSDERYLLALKRIRKSIADGGQLTFGNSDSMCDKHNECSWGMCSNDPAHWPDAGDHLWPDLFEKEGRVATLYFKPHQVCPMDRRMNNGNMDVSDGCFWNCRVFRAGKGQKVTREQALELFDQAIARMENNLPDSVVKTVM